MSRSNTPEYLKPFEETIQGSSADSVLRKAEVGGSPLDPSYQDVFSDYLEELDSDDADDEIYASLVEEAMQAFTTEEVDSMTAYLKDKGMLAFIKRYVGELGIPPSKLILAFGVILAPQLREEATDEDYLDLLKMALSETLRTREKLPQYNTLDDAIKLLSTSKRIIVLTGAGISVSCGIPDFRSAEGIYAQLKTSSYGQYLEDPQQMFDLSFFKENPDVFYSFARHIYPSNFTPSPCHDFIKLLDDQGQLLRNYTQNIDTLETVAGVKNVLQCHGSFATASCIVCGHKVDGSEIRDDIFAQRVPRCSACAATNAESVKSVKAAPRKKKQSKRPWEDEDSDEERDLPQSIMKPDITFFGEKLSDKFDKALFEDRERVDLLVVIGTSLTVAPVSGILSHIPHSVPQILVNKTPLPHVNPDIILLGEADGVAQYLCRRLGWELPDRAAPSTASSLSTVGAKRTRGELEAEPVRVPNSHVWLFSGAEGGSWLDKIRLARSTVATPSPSESAMTNRKTAIQQGHLTVPKDDGHDSDSSKGSKRRRLL